MAQRHRRVIPGAVKEIRYQRTGRSAGPYYHRFKEPVAMRANRDGSVTLKARRRLWADDREPDFDRYVTRGRRNPMAKGGGSGLGWLLAAVGVVLVLKPDLLTGLFGGTSTASLGLQQQPQGYWFNPDTLSLVYQLGLTPPAAGYRAASQYEVSTYYPGNM